MHLNDVRVAELGQKLHLYAGFASAVALNERELTLIEVT